MEDRGGFSPPFHKSLISFLSGEVVWVMCAATNKRWTYTGRRKTGRQSAGQIPQKARGTEAWGPQARVNNNLQGTVASQFGSWSAGRSTQYWWIWRSMSTLYRQQPFASNRTIHMMLIHLQCCSSVWCNQDDNKELCRVVLPPSAPSQNDCPCS